MGQLKLLFSKESLIYQLVHNKKVREEDSFLLNEDLPKNHLLVGLEQVLNQNNFTEIEVISAINHFAPMPFGFSEHTLGNQLIGFNSNVISRDEELMLAYSKKHDIQFYYSLPKEYYMRIKDKNCSSKYTYSGEVFLRKIRPKHSQEIHINLYHHQCEFFAFGNRKIVLYNNLDSAAEVDFLYFVLYAMKKIGFDARSSHFYVYGETAENEVFLTELRKFVSYFKVVFDNFPKKNFILNI